MTRARGAAETAAPARLRFTCGVSFGEWQFESPTAIEPESAMRPFKVMRLRLCAFLVILSARGSDLIVSTLEICRHPI